MSIALVFIVIFKSLNLTKKEHNAGEIGDGDRYDASEIGLDYKNTLIFSILTP